jgi:hypothetical protein
MIHIKWQKPDQHNGAVVDVYHVMVLQHYNEKYTRVEECEWAVGQPLECEVSMDTLTSEPFYLHVGDKVKAKVVAMNKIGPSRESQEGG